MYHQKKPHRILIATKNAGKVKELQAVFQQEKINVLDLNTLKQSSVEETGFTFVENALLKARAAAQQTEMPVIADDSGLEVDILNGAPGIYSARYAGVGATDQENIALLLENLKEIPAEARTARYVCVLVYLTHPADPTPLIFQGFWEGSILTSPRGAGGFGYDPIFWVPSKQCSAAELSSEEKNKLSHRGNALNQLVRALKEMWRD